MQFHYGNMVEGIKEKRK